MFWALPLDDFDGEFCNQGKFPLIRAVTKELNEIEQPMVSSSTPVPATTILPPTKSSQTQPTAPTQEKTEASSTLQTRTTIPEPKVTILKTNKPLITRKICRPIAIWKNVQGMTWWCNVNCRTGNCPPSHCVCSTEVPKTLSTLPVTEPPVTSKTPLTVSATPTLQTNTLLVTSQTVSEPVRPRRTDRTPITRKNCHPTITWKNVKGMDWWCDVYCKGGYCPPSHCVCSM